MQVKKCGFCGKVFNSLGSPICVECLEEMEPQYITVRDYLYDHPNATIEMVVQGTEVPEKVVIYLLKDGRIRMSSATGLLRCDQCGTAIETGRFCPACSDKLESRITQATLSRMAKKTASPRMHTNRT